MARAYMNEYQREIEGEPARVRPDLAQSVSIETLTGQFHKERQAANSDVER
jgi:hypothetical protein